MGLRNWFRNHRMTDPVAGTFQVMACSAGGSGAVYSNCRMTGVVTAKGVRPVAVEHYCTAPSRRWPQPGQRLPVTVDRADPTRMRVRWDEVPTGRERARQVAEQMASLMSVQPRPATACVVAVANVVLPPGTIEPAGYSAGFADLTLEVDGYTTVIRFGFSTPDVRARLGVVGAVVPVLVDPADPRRIAVDTSRLS